MPQSRAGRSKQEDACVRDYYARVVGEAERNVATLASLLPGTRWEDVSSIPIEDSEYVAALAKLERLVKLRVSFEAEVLQKGAETRQVEDFRVRGYLAGATTEVFNQVGLLASGLRSERQKTSLERAGRDLRLGPPIPSLSDEIPIRELFDNDPSLGREVFKMSRYLSLEPMPIGSDVEPSCHDWLHREGRRGGR